MERRGSRLSRREFVVGAGVAGLGLLAGCGRWPGQPERPAKVPRMGWLTGVSAASGQADIVRQALRDFGWIDGQNILLEFRFADGHAERFRDLAAELVRLPVDVLATVGSLAIHAAKDATDTIPIVMVNAQDPIRSGFIESLARPGGNITGLSALATGLSEKRWDLLKDVVPGMSRVAVLRNREASAAAGLAPDLAEIEATARQFGMQPMRLDFQDVDSLERVFEMAVRERVDAIMIQTDALTLTNRLRIAELAAAGRLPTMSDRREYVEAGGLLSYGPNATSSYRRAAYYVDRILKGAKPADLPVEQPMTFDFVVNMNTAREMGITFPNEIMLQVTEVIQ
jgi:putative tryptophan/tyrosine transport system substrate-binding protein